MNYNNSFLIGVVILVVVTYIISSIFDKEDKK